MREEDNRDSGILNAKIQLRYFDTLFPVHQINSFYEFEYLNLEESQNVTITIHQ